MSKRVRKSTSRFMCDTQPEKKEKLSTQNNTTETSEVLYRKPRGRPRKVVTECINKDFSEAFDASRNACGDNDSLLDSTIDMTNSDRTSHLLEMYSDFNVFYLGRDSLFETEREHDIQADYDYDN